MHLSMAECAPRSRRIQILCDSEKLTETSIDVIRILGLKDDDDVDPEALIEDIARVEVEAAKKRTLHLLNYRERTRQEVVTRLLDEGYTDGTVITVADRFEDVGLIDDSRFAEQYVRSKLFAYWGRSKIFREMKHKGVGEELAISTLDEICPELEEVDRALSILRSRRFDPKTDRDRALSYLARRGFRPGDAISALNIHAKDIHTP